MGKKGLVEVLQELRGKIKCVIVGDGAVGKTCMLMSYSLNEFPEGYVPTVFDNYTADITIDGQRISFELCDTAGQEDFSHIRKFSYNGADVLILCYSVVQPTSFDNIQNKWLEEVASKCPDVPFILCGLKTDLRASTKQTGGRVITLKEAKRLKKKIKCKASAYVECSAFQAAHSNQGAQAGLSNVFNTAIRAAIDAKTDPSSQICPLM